jgi:copper(I)-binding protein
MRHIIFVIFLLFSANLAYAGDNILLEEAWARPASAGNHSAVYLDINNKGSASDTLIDVTTEVAEHSSIHKSIVENDIAQMITVDKLAIPAHNIVKFTPGGLHIMICDLKQDLKLGDKISLVFKFEKQGKVRAIVLVQQK